MQRGGDLDLAARLEGNFSLVRKELCQGTVSCPLVHSKVFMHELIVAARRRPGHILLIHIDVTMRDITHSNCVHLQQKEYLRPKLRWLVLWERMGDTEGIWLCCDYSFI